MTDPFDDPAPPSGAIDWSTTVTRLCLFSVIAVEASIKTASYGEKEAVRADLAILDGPDAGKRYDNCLVFPGVLIGQLKPKVGKLVLGRMEYGEAKTGQKPPYRLATATEADKAVGQRYLTHIAGQRIADPEPPPDDPWASAPAGGQPPF